MALITALMTTYNCDSFVEDTIQSILEQSLSDFEFLILDDGSTDETCQKVLSFSDSRIRFHSFAENKGVGYRLNQALRMIDTPFIAKVDADDISVTSRFAEQYNYLLQNPSIDIVKSYFEYFADDQTIAKSERFQDFRLNKEAAHNTLDTPNSISNQLYRWNCVMHTTYFARSSVIKNVGYEPVRVGEDYGLFYRANMHGIKIGCVPKVLVKMRLSQSSVTTQYESAYHFATVLFNLKFDDIQWLVGKYNQVWIYGTGALAKALMEVLVKNNIDCLGFVDRENGSLLVSDTLHPVTNIDSFTAKPIIIAAQPVRAEISRLLEERDYEEWNDYMVFA